MLNKKSMEANPMSLVIIAAILLAVLLVFFYGILPIFTGKQVPFIKGQTEYTTQDCDGDGAIGLSDPCPCFYLVKSREDLEKQTDKKCPLVGKNSQATTSCPDLCKPNV